MSAVDDRDDIDALFSRLERAEPPDDFLARVMARAREGEVARWSPWRRLGFGLLYVTALLGLGVLAFLLGSELEHTQAREIIQLALQDLSSVKDSPGIYLSALRDAIPWFHLLALVADLTVLAVATRMLLRAPAPPTRQDSPAVAG